MGNNASIKKINFEDVQYMINDPNIIIINTLPEQMQHCLIKNTINASNEADVLNKLIAHNLGRRIILYGMNATDDKLSVKYNQLSSLGFSNVHVYIGGIFEWVLLQDIYGDDLFPTTKKEQDLLKFKGRMRTNTLMILDN